MKRDGATSSLWQQGTGDYQSSGTTSMATECDVLIAGGGITGITTALLLQKAGKKVIVAEAHSLCFGTTGGTTAHVNTFLDTSYDMIENDFSKEAAIQIADATRTAKSLFERHVAEYKIECGFHTTDGYVYAQNKKQEEQLADMLAAAKRAGAEAGEAPETPVPIGFTKAMVYRGQAALHPAKYVMALAKVFEEGRGIILQNTAVNDFKKHDDHLHVQTTAGNIKAKNLVWATHIPPGINLLHFRAAPYRSYAIAVTLEYDDYPVGLAYDMYDPYHYYRTQEVNGQKYLIIGGEDHKTGHQPEADSAAENTEACFAKLIAHAKTFFSVKEVAHRWSSQYFEPSDGLAYIGHLPGNPDNVYVATGYGGNGITYSHIAAQVLTDLITTGQSELKDLFSPARVKPVAGFAAFVQENADVVKEFIAKRIAVKKIEGLSELAHGEARVVKYDGETVAIYKDEQGAIHALNPVCTHAKCIVAWNNAEKSWDCPCHGARYDVSGEVLTGPARKPLERIELEQE